MLRTIFLDDLPPNQRFHAIMDIRAISITVLSAVFMMPAAAINAIYQYDRGGPFAIPLAAVAITSIIMAGVTPITFMRSLRNLNAFGVIISAIVFMVSIGFNLSNATGIAAFERDKTVTTRSTASDSMDRLRWQLSTYTNSRTDLAREADGKAAASFLAELAGQRQDASWTATKQCTDATIPTSRMFCAKYKAREAQLAAAQKVEELDVKIDAINRQIDTLHIAPGQVADPQASAVNFALNFLGFKAKDGDVGTGLSLWFALLIEVIASLAATVFQLLLEPSKHASIGDDRRRENGGDQRREECPPLIVTKVIPASPIRQTPVMQALPAPEPAKKPERRPPGEEVASIESWMAQCVITRRNHEIRAAECYASYTEWCTENGIQPASNNRFGRVLGGDLKVKRVEKGGRNYYQGIAFKPAAAETRPAGPPELRVVSN